MMIMTVQDHHRNNSHNSTNSVSIIHGDDDDDDDDGPHNNDDLEDLMNVNRNVTSWVICDAGLDECEQEHKPHA